MIRDSLYFTYNDESSEKYGIVNVSIDSGMQSEPFASNREIQEIEIPGNEQPYFQRVKRRSLEFTMQFAFEEKWDKTKIQEIKRWICQDYYKPLIFSEDPDRIYYAMVKDNSTIVHNCLQQGYVELHFRCKDPFAYSSANETSALVAGTYSIYNDGDVSMFPEMWITTIGSGNVSIANVTTSKTTTFTGLAALETVYVNNEKEDIVSDTTLPRYSAYNNVPLELPVGDNQITITGDATVKFKYQFKYL